ncbi:MAG: hypothetical protein JAY74_19845 [Candidatus Thiodiazotropha taylori]|nr:hypothetical protein [Candidatus Thiodiazotropha taylori]
MAWWVPIAKAGLKAVGSGLATGIGSGIAARAHDEINRGGNKFNNAGSGLAAMHENMYDTSAGHQFEMQRLQHDADFRLQHMKDATTIELQKMQMKHDAIMSSVSKGHKGVREVLDFFLGKEKSQFWKSYKDIMGNQ